MIYLREFYKHAMHDADWSKPLYILSNFVFVTILLLLLLFIQNLDSNFKNPRSQLHTRTYINKKKKKKKFTS